jgi:hypothetical protein
MDWHKKLNAGKYEQDNFTGILPVDGESDHAGIINAAAGSKPRVVFL